MGWKITEAQFNSWQGKEVFLFHKNIRNSSGVDPASCSVSTGGFFSGCQAGLFLQGYSSWDMKLNTHLHFVTRLRMNVAIPLLLSVPSWCAQEELALHHLNQVNSFIPYLPSGHFPTSVLCMHFLTLWCWK